MSENDAAHAAALPAPVRGPLLAHAVVFLGFAVIFSVFATEALASVVIGLGLVIAGGLWEGAAPEEPLIGAADGAEEPHGSGH